MAFYNLVGALAARGLDSNADAVSGALFYVFTTGTTTPVATFTDITGNTANAHPVVADASGAWNGIYVPVGDYRVDIRTSGGASLPGYPVDDVSITADLETFANKAAVEAATIDASVNQISIDYYATAGDLGGGDYNRVASEPTHNAKIQSGDGAWWELKVIDRISVTQTGATPDAADSYTALNDAYQAARIIANSRSVVFTGASSTEFANIKVVHPDFYNTSQQLVLDAARVDLVGPGGLVPTGDASEDLSDFVIKFTGVTYNNKVEDLRVECTSAGGIEFDCNNSSGARVEITRCRFAPDRFGAQDSNTNTETAIKYTNQSSRLVVRDCFINKVRHPLHVVNCDFVEVEDGFFGNVNEVHYANKSALFLVDNGFFRFNGDINAAGPAWYSGKVDSQGAPIAQYTEVAYFNIGTEATPVFTDTARALIEAGRIGFEQGDGSLVNYFVRHDGNSGAANRGSVVIQNVMTAPQEDEVEAADGTTDTPLVRMFHAPHVLHFRGVHSENGRTGLVAAGSTTSLAAIRAVYEDPIPYTSQLADIQIPNSSNSFVLDGVSCPVINTALPGASDAAAKLEANRWSELFGRFNYIFETDAPGGADSGNTIYVDTFMTGTSNTPDAAMVWEVLMMGFNDNTGGARLVSPVHGYLHSEYDQAADTVRLPFKLSLDHSNMARSIEVTGFWNTSTTPVETVTLANAATSTIGLRIQHADNPGTEAIRYRRALIRPFYRSLNSLPNGGVKQY